LPFLLFQFSFLLFTMYKHLKKLRALPEGKRKVIVLFSSAGVTALILISWLVFPVQHFGSLSEAEKERKNAGTLIAPFSLIGGELHGAFGGIKEKWASLGGTAGVLSVVSALKENIPEGATTTTPTSTPESIQNKESLSAQETFLAGNTTSSTSEMTTTTTEATSTGSAGL
jgi:hypothetical protein